MVVGLGVCFVADDLLVFISPEARAVHFVEIAEFALAEQQELSVAGLCRTRACTTTFVEFTATGGYWTCHGRP